MRRRWGVWVILLGILFFEQLAGIGGNVWGQIPFDWEPFGIDKTLLPDFSIQLRQRDSLQEGAGLGPFEDHRIGLEKTPAAEGFSAPEARLGRLRLYLSRFPFSDVDRDVERPMRDRTGAFDRFKSLPDDLRTNPGRAFQSMGEIFQPQLNLGIEF